MELEEMQSLWSNLTEKVDAQKRLTDQLILEMTQTNYKSKIGKVINLETLGTIASFLGALYLLVHIGKLDTWYLMLCGIYSIAHLVLIPIFSLRAFYKLQKIDIQHNSLKKTLIDFTKAKKNVFLFQKIGMGFNFVLMVVCLPVFAKITSGNDLFFESNVLYWYIPLGIICLSLVSWWSYKKLIGVVNRAGVLLKELEE